MKIVVNNKIFQANIIENEKTVEITSPNGYSTKCAIHKDGENNEFFYLPDLNLLDSMPHDLDIEFFGRPADAINAIFDGWADACFSAPNLFVGIFSSNRNLYPIYFLDRNIGNLMRCKSIEGWKKRPDYKWVIVRSNNSLCPNEHYLRSDWDKLPLDDKIKTNFMFEIFYNVSPNGDIKSYKINDIVIPASKIMMFDTKEEALEFIPKVSMIDNLLYDPRQFIIINT